MRPRSQFFLKHFQFLAALCGLMACQGPASFDGFDSESWKKDRMACGGTRQRLRPDFDRMRPDLMALTQMDVVALLGRPDLLRLDERNMKSYLYYLEPAATCPGGKPDARVAILRFNAVDRVFEITYEQGAPL